MISSIFFFFCFYVLPMVFSFGLKDFLLGKEIILNFNFVSIFFFKLDEKKKVKK